MKTSFVILFFLLFPVYSFSQLTSDKKVIIQQFPPENWDGKKLEYGIMVFYPDFKEKTKVEAEEIKKYYVRHGLENGLRFIFNIAEFNPMDFTLLYQLSCNDSEKFKALFPHPEKENIELKKLCNTDDKSLAKNIIINPYSHELTTRDITSKAFDNILAFLKLPLGDFPNKYFKELHMKQSVMPPKKIGPFITDMGNTNNKAPVILIPAKETRNIDNDTIYFAPHEQFLLKNTTTDTRISADIQYTIPYLAVELSSTGSIEGFYIPNAKLVTLFQSSAPNLNHKMLIDSHHRIIEKIKNYDIALKDSDKDLLTSSPEHPLYKNKSSWLVDVDLDKVRKQHRLWA